MLPEQKEEAETLRIGIVAGFTTVAEPVAWVDRVILFDPRPDAAVLEVSLAGRRSPADMVALLREIPGEADPVRVMRRVLARMLRTLEADPDRRGEIAPMNHVRSLHRGQQPGAGHRDRAADALDAGESDDLVRGVASLVLSRRQ